MTYAVLCWFPCCILATQLNAWVNYVLLTTQVTGIYPASSWRHISEHLHDILGKQCAELGDAGGALRHCTALLDCGHRPPAAQTHYLTRFLEAVQAAGVTGVGLVVSVIVSIVIRRFVAVWQYISSWASNVLNCGMLKEPSGAQLNCVHRPPTAHTHYIIRFLKPGNQGTKYLKCIAAGLSAWICAFADGYSRLSYTSL